jgi:hypothetical protein
VCVSYGAIPQYYEAIPELNVQTLVLIVMEETDPSHTFLETITKKEDTWECLVVQNPQKGVFLVGQRPELDVFPSWITAKL